MVKLSDAQMQAERDALARPKKVERTSGGYWPKYRIDERADSKWGVRHELYVMRRWWPFWRLLGSYPKNEWAVKAAREHALGGPSTISIYEWAQSGLRWLSTDHLKERK